MTGTEVTYEVTYTERMVRDAVRTYVWRWGIARQKGLWVAELAMLAFFVYLLWDGNRSWVTGVVGTSVLLPPLLLALIWTAHHRSTVGRFRRMPTPVADITFRDDGLGIASELGSGHLSWSSMTEIWERPGYWMIFSGPNQFATLPVEAISGDDLELLRSKVSRPHLYRF